MYAHQRTTNIDIFLHIGTTFSFWGCCSLFKERFQGTNIEPHCAEFGHSGIYL